MHAPQVDLMGWALWSYVGYLMLMFGIAWLSVMRLSRGLQRPLGGVVVFNLLTGLSLVLVGWRDSLPFWPSHTLANLMQVTGYVVLWRACEVLVGRLPSSREQLAVLLLGNALVLWFGMSPDDEQRRVAASFGANGWAAVRGGWLIARRLRIAGSRQTAAMALLYSLGVGLPLLARGMAGLVAAPGVDVDIDFLASQRLAYVCLVVVFGVNILIATYVFGRVVRDVERLSRRDPLTGLDDRSTVEQVLDFEWARHRRRGRPLPLLALALDDLSPLCSQWSAATCDVVVAEVALLLRAHLRPGDVLGHVGNGAFLMLLPNTSLDDAGRLASRLLRSVAHDRGLHPDGQQALTVSVGLAEAGGAGRADALVALAESRCRLAQQGGGNRLVDGGPGQAQAAETPPPIVA